MARANDTNELLYQNLCDAGCSEALTQECMELAENGMTKRMVQRLKGQRTNLLDEIHQAENSLRCLEYLLFQIEQNQSNGGKVK